MSTLEVWIIIILIVGVIASNLAALKYSAKFKLPQFGQHGKDKQIKPGTTEPSAAENDADDASSKPSSADSEPNKADK
ncbi:MAG: DUF2897 family protein [Shewanella sp.]|jgi:hypothetical protein|uniref:DUF2897 family protein n=1 Tax=unclassified Shewanella TaxID=196818 RepID=UPI0021D9386A|nr:MULTISPECIES: DUF2897 family protein [unclassified Shewanella]MCU8002710.1 DUF2897 family protein [Shewanella sp. SM96]MCU8071259.1 DUF2897 family protein [Shewanella sp. SM32]